MNRRFRRYQEDWIPTGVLAGVIVAVNGLLVQEAYRDCGWGAFGTALAISPLVNFILLVLGAVLSLVVFHGSRQEHHPIYLSTALGLPVFAFMADLMVISFFPLHGC